MSLTVGIYSRDISPESGGASSLLSTVQKEILNDTTNDIKYIFIYEGSKNTAYKTYSNGFTYINKHKAKKEAKLRLKDCIKKVLNKKVIDPTWDYIAKKEGIDIFYIPEPTHIETSIPYIYTVWDLGHRTTPYFPEVSRTGWIWESRESMYQNVLYKASFIITGNQEGKKEILTNYPMPENKIIINPFPVAAFCRGKEEKPVFDLPEQYFFYPAQFWPHKNHICILNALKILKEKNNLTPKVFFTGSDKGNRKYIEDKISEYGLQNQVQFTGFVKDEELKYLYTHATAMIFASLMGPNNMPPIESTFLNCPVIITDLDGHKEQLKDTALYFNGYCPEELAKQMKLLLTNKAKRTLIISKQKKLAKEFDSVNYFATIKKLLLQFNDIRNTWGDEYIHR